LQPEQVSFAGFWQQELVDAAAIGVLEAILKWHGIGVVGLPESEVRSKVKLKWESEKMNAYLKRFLEGVSWKVLISNCFSN